MKGQRQQKSVMRRGFTLLELLVVIAIIGTLVALLFPVLKGVMIKGKMAAALSNGSGIHKALMAAALDGRRVYPKTKGVITFQNSTEYWKWLVAEEVVDVGFDFFSASGLENYKGIDPAKFTPTHNAWCITADLSDATRNMTPLLFTRNLKIEQLDDPVEDAVQDINPFGTEGVVVVTYGGSAQIIRPDKIAESFNPAKAGNPILRP